MACGKKISDKSQNVHTADLGYLGFQDYHKKIFSSVASKLREATPPGRQCNRSIESFYREVEYVYDSLLNSCKLPTLVSRRQYLKLSFSYQVIHGSFTFPNAATIYVPPSLHSSNSLQSFKHNY